MSGVPFPGAATRGWRRRLAMPAGIGIAPSTLLAILVAVAGYRLAARISELGLWHDGTAQRAGRAILSAAGQSDPTALLTSYPPLPYMLLVIGEMLGRPLGLDPVALVDAALLGGLAARYGGSLAERGASTGIVMLLVLLLALHPLSITAITRGPQGLLMLWGSWVLGRSMMDTRTVTGINETIALSLALPMLAMTGAQGAAIAVGAIPFLIFAVPRDLAERHYLGTYLVLLFPLVLSGLSLFALFVIILHTPLTVIIGDVYHAVRSGTPPGWAIVTLAPIATAGVAVIAVLLSTMRTAPRALRESVAAGLASLMLASVLVVATGIARHPGELLVPALGFAAGVSTRWPVEKLGQAGLSILVGALVAAPVILGTDAKANGLVMQLMAERTGAVSPDRAVGRYLVGHRGVMIDALAHPAVVAERGSAADLLTDRSPVFGVSVLAHRVFTPAVAVRAHRPGESDDAISRSMPKLFEQGPPGYRLVFDRDGWRVWARTERSKIP
ncbi:hypothetical protein [uncultured Sphingomonas sp.]|uniref:hypothetical protein n=1 Tax=uncultured Sphingomonas sp. TaxID=158754 RepID=UPI0025E4E291|nr:hypothetical protein [uncultured Sphingomonas sp.]